MPTSSQRSAVALGLALLWSISTAEAAVLCAGQKKNGSFNSQVTIREACRKKEKQLDLAALECGLHWHGHRPLKRLPNMREDYIGGG
jgi:hypothetical protein